jgi:hypothetical protein
MARAKGLIQPHEIKHNPVGMALGRLKVTATSIAKMVKAEMEAHETQTVKVQGVVTAEEVGNARVIAKSDRETVLAVDQIAWTVRRNARLDAAKYLGIQPAEQHELTGEGGGPIAWTYFPPEPKTAEEWEEGYRKMTEEKARVEAAAKPEGGE